MEFTFSEEQSQFRDVVRRFCRDKSPAAVVRRTLEDAGGFEPQVWKQICQDLGMVAIHVAEDRGGGGFGPVELGIVMEEFGRCLIPQPYLSSVLASTALAQVGDGERLMQALTAGDQIVTLALDAHHGEPVCSELRMGDGRLHGVTRLVPDGHTADLVLLIVPVDDRPTLLAVRSAAPGLTTRPLRTMDTTRPMARLTFDGCEADALGPLDDAQVKRVYDTALVALANEMVGGAQALLEATVEYVKTRVQFGRPIGSFQAIKHRLADLLTDVELARVAAYQAAQALASDEEVSANASLAKFVASDAYMTAAREAIQLHGGIGFTWENDTHLWYRRAKSSEVLLGTPAFHRERMLQEMNV